MNAAYEKQALENAAAAVQHSQSAKVNTRHFNGMEIKGTSTGLSIDGKAAAVIEKNKDATVYQQGLYNFIVYANGKIAVLRTACLKLRQIKRRSGICSPVCLRCRGSKGLRYSS